MSSTVEVSANRFPVLIWFWALVVVVVNGWLVLSAVQSPTIPVETVSPFLVAEKHEEVLQAERALRAAAMDVSLRWEPREGVIVQLQNPSMEGEFKNLTAQITAKSAHKESMDFEAALEPAPDRPGVYRIKTQDLRLRLAQARPVGVWFVQLRLKAYGRSDMLYRETLRF